MWYSMEDNQVLNMLRFGVVRLIIKKLKTDKLETKSKKGRFVGYSKESFGYYFYLPTSQRVVISRDAIFFEQKFIQEVGKGRQIESELENSDQRTDQIDIDPSN